MENLETIQWDTMKDNGTITTSSDHFIKSGEDKTLCGRKLPHDTAMDIYGTGYNTVSCKSCNKIAKAKKKDTPVVKDNSKKIVFEECDSDTVYAKVFCGTMLENTTVLTRGTERTFIQVIKEYCTVDAVVSHGIIF